MQLDSRKCINWPLLSSSSGHISTDGYWTTVHFDRIHSIVISGLTASSSCHLYAWQSGTTRSQYTLKSRATGYKNRKNMQHTFPKTSLTIDSLLAHDSIYAELTHPLAMAIDTHILKYALHFFFYMKNTHQWSSQRSLFGLRLFLDPVYIDLKIEYMGCKKKPDCTHNVPVGSGVCWSKSRLGIGWPLDWPLVPQKNK